jgi:hypothetical protein
VRVPAGSALLACATTALSSRSLVMRAVNAPTTSLFVYGTLMAEEVLRPLVGRVPVRRVGTIFGFSRGCVRGEAFPAVLRTGADDQVEGLLIEDLLPRELRALDYYASRRHSNREPCDVNLQGRFTPHETHHPGG